MALTEPLSTGAATGVHPVPLQVASLAPAASPPAVVKAPPTYRTPGTEALSAKTDPLSEGVPGVPPSPGGSLPPGPAASDTATSETAATAAETPTSLVLADRPFGDRMASSSLAPRLVGRSEALTPPSQKPVRKRSPKGD